MGDNQKTLKDNKQLTQILFRTIVGHTSLYLYPPPYFHFLFTTSYLSFARSQLFGQNSSYIYSIVHINSIILQTMADLGSASSKRMWCSIPEKFQLHVAMLALQFGYAGFHVVSRAALNMGVSKLVFPVYRNIIALLLLLPFAYFLEKLAPFL